MLTNIFTSFYRYLNIFLIENLIHTIGTKINYYFQITFVISNTEIMSYNTITNRNYVSEYIQLNGVGIQKHG